MLWLLPVSLSHSLSLSLSLSIYLSMFYYIYTHTCIYILGEIVGVVGVEELGKRKRDGEDYTHDPSKRMSHVLDSAGLELSHKP